MEKQLNLSVYNIRICYFFKEKSELRPFELINLLYNQFKDILKTEPQSIPMSNDAPEEVPCCIWSDADIRISFNKLQLDLSFNIPLELKWEDLLKDYNKKIMSAIDEHKIVIDRVGLVSDIMSSDDLAAILREHIQLDKFNQAGECNISWLERIDFHNIWTYFFINKKQEMNKIMFDINSFPEKKLSDSNISGETAINMCAEKLKGKMKNVF